VLALLSPHAVRRAMDAGNSTATDSVCLDEIAYARGARKIPIVPVQVVSCEAPFLVYRLHQIDFRRWRESEATYQAGLNQICAGIEAALRGETPERSWRPLLEPWDFAPFLLEKRNHFTGRQWLFRDLDEWRSKQAPPALLITGEPGIGKSAIVAALVDNNPDGQVLAYHCCRADTPVDSYYKLVKTVESDPKFDTKRAKKKLRRYVESHDHAIRLKAEIMVDHFHEQVMALNKIGGQARAMVVCSSIERAIQYFHAFKAYLVERKSAHQAIVAFSGEHEYGGAKVTESSLNGFSSSDIAEKIQEEPYRFLVCADKFQTGYDEPLLHTMYVDKALSGVKAVQTLSRLNRAHPQKHDVFVLDFMNNSGTISLAFADYYRTTILADETDPNKLHDLKTALDSHQIYHPDQIEKLVALYLGGASRETLDPILDDCVATYLAQLDEDEQVDFKGKAKAFVRTYDFLASVLPYSNAAWEKLSIFLNFLVLKLPAPMDEDLAKGILEAIDMDSYRVEKKAALKVLLPDDNAEIEPIPVSGGGRKLEAELDRLSNILKTFNDQFGTLFTDADRVVRRITEDIVPKVAADQSYLNAKKNTPNAARIELDAALMRVINPLLKDDTEFYKQFVQNESFKRFVTDMVANLTSE
jgi:type I restriction enzyme, R subunit